MLYEEMIEREYRKALKVPLTQIVVGGGQIVLFRADALQAGVKTPIGPCLVAHYLDRGLLNDKTKAVVIHGSGNTVRAVKTAVDELLPGKHVIAVVYRETGKETKASLSTLGIEVIAESPRSRGQAGRQTFTEKLCQKNKWLLIEQHEQPLIVDIQHRTFGRAIVKLIRNRRNVPVPNEFVAGVGTGGTLFGIGSALRNLNPYIELTAVEGVGSTLTLWHAYLNAKGQGFQKERAAIKRALRTYKKAGMIVSLKSYPHRKNPEEWFEIDIDFPSTQRGVVGIEGLGVGDPSNLIREHLLEVDRVRIITDKQAAEGVEHLEESHGIHAVESAGANFYMAAELAKESRRWDKGGGVISIPMLTIITAGGKEG